MATSLNRASLIGNVGRDPEIRTMSNGDKVVNLSVATTKKWRDRNSGQDQERTEWHSIVVFDAQLIKVSDLYIRKGTKVFVEGELRTRKWTDQSGVEKYKTEIVLNGFGALLKVLSGGNQQNSQSSQGFDGNSGGYENQQDDDDIPF